jgi:hypothetical protein
VRVSSLDQANRIFRGATASDTHNVLVVDEDLRGLAIAGYEHERVDPGQAARRAATSA